MSTSASKKARRAGEFGLTLTEYKRLTDRLRDARQGLSGSATARRAAAAKRLGITPSELKMIDDHFNGPAAKASERCAAAARVVVGRKSTQRPSKSGAAPPTKSKGYQTVLGAAWSRDTTVWITPWGDVVHIYSDCVATRGFRYVNEPDPRVDPVRVADSRCAGRRLCGTCLRSIDHHRGSAFEDYLVSFHGEPLNGRTTRPKGAKPRRPGRPAPTSKAGATSSKSPAKKTSGKKASPKKKSQPASPKQRKPSPELPRTISGPKKPPGKKRPSAKV